MSKAVVLLGNTTEHGGKIITAIDEYTHNDIPIIAKNKITRRR
ncbi:hypothetical protein [Photorhabdus luminescens]|nr:hypothetical protein [Photorhabdus luminescens]MCW7762948.1 hypothetical protein [Photorhabdus luminescens subsp. venezuelensis]